MRDLGVRMSSQDVALSNARRASTALSRRRVERAEVALWLEGLDRAEPSALRAAEV